MYFAINVLGVAVFLAIGVLFSKKRKEIQWRSVGALLILNVFLAWFPDVVSCRPRDHRGCSRWFQLADQCSV
ncbi:MAG: hypothetical protein LKE51_00950 [Selenomonas sp.]|jgi:nucleoside permease NupC|nr:hypothetical protein [Selenomonas sp.]